MGNNMVYNIIICDKHNLQFSPNCCVNSMILHKFFELGQLFFNDL